MSQFQALLACDVLYHILFLTSWPELQWSIEVGYAVQHEALYTME